MKNLNILFASELSKKITLDPIEGLVDNGKKFKRSAVESTVGSIIIPQTILQLNTIPLKIDINKYKNAHSADNPTGDYKAAYLFSVLANTIPELSACYNNSPYLVTDTWDSIIHSANSNVFYTQRLLEKSKEKFKSSSLSGMGGIPDNWYPVYANPSNWYDIIQDESKLIKIVLDLQSGESDMSNFIVMNDNTPLTWKVINRKNEIRTLNMSPDSQIKKIHLKVLKIDFMRPWFNFEVLDQQNWEIKGLKKGYYSNGNLYENKGIFPLLTQSVLIGTEVSLKVDFSQRDINKILENIELGENLSIGPFLMNSDGKEFTIDQGKGEMMMSSNIKQIIGYLSRLVPISPGLSNA